MSFNKIDEMIPFTRCKECDRSFRDDLMIEGLCPSCNEELIDDLNKRYAEETFDETLSLANSFDNQGMMAAFALGVLQYHFLKIASEDDLWKVINSVTEEMNKRMEE